MRSLVCLVSIAALAMAEEPKPRSWTVEGVKREALVVAPKGESPPLVFVFHGHGGTAKGASLKQAIHKHWPGAAVVYPQGLPTPGKLTDPEGKKSGWQHGIEDQKGRDLLFFDAMLRSLKKDHGVDEKRVYATGHSNGGGFTYTLWAARGEALAAVAPSGAAGPAGAWDKLGPKPVLHVAGEKDALVKFAWQERAIERLKAVNGKGGPPVATYIHGGGHEYPAAANGRIVEFFKGHAKK